ncbi:copper resistance CopC/CopD family protein [Blastococcus sp. Marseille-P5729]|uniref:copper resistance CopC/CopD family protein n=1 Tax=Blastococcus sp. Marseille-P5729 TaxID=2086582 RepID=UPI000D0EEEED|nr:copper resistance protein CopC [Blastococcus sp. Marseille-P5729]
MRTPTGALQRAVLILLVAVAAVVSAATAASAHATLVTSTPGNGDVLDAAPAQVTVEFTEPVTITTGYFRVLDADGERVDSGNPVVDGSSITVALPADLPDGGYVATWRVVSADSHPVSGAISFAVGDAAPPQIDSQGTQIGQASEDPVIGVLYPLTRWVGYAGLALLAGVFVLALIDPVLRTSISLRRWAWGGFDAALGATVLGALLQGPYAAGQGIGSLVDPALMSATIETDVGRMAAVRLMLLGVLGVVMWEWFNAERDKRVLAWAGTGVVVVCAATHAASGHAVADDQPWLTIPLDTAHLAAAAGWIGGLAILLLCVLGRRGPLSQGEQRAIARRFSPVAASFVGVVVLTGVVQAWVRVGAWGALLETTYGRLLLAKSALLVLALGAALLTRRLVIGGRQHPDLLRDGECRGGRESGLGDAEVRGEGELASSARRPVLFEAIAGTAAIAVAAVLVATPPARDVYAVARDAQIAFDNGYMAQVSLDPARTGSNTLHVYLFDRSNALAPIEEAEVSLRNDEAQIGPLEVDARNVGQGHFIASGVELPAAGSWTVTVKFTEPGFGAVSAEGSIDVG